MTRPNESLTPYNREILKEAKRKATELKYAFPGYTVKGQVRV